MGAGRNELGTNLLRVRRPILQRCPLSIRLAGEHARPLVLLQPGFSDRRFVLPGRCHPARRPRHRHNPDGDLLCLGSDAGVREGAHRSVSRHIAASLPVQHLSGLLEAVPDAQRPQEVHVQRVVQLPRCAVQTRRGGAQCTRAHNAANHHLLRGDVASFAAALIASRVVDTGGPVARRFADVAAQHRAHDSGAGGHALPAPGSFPGNLAEDRAVLVAAAGGTGVAADLHDLPGRLRHRRPVPEVALPPRLSQRLH
mmetsp:Transcript_20925/g.59763  ORF Transcript_20925/g.59763 Transcript_20925/m.59763 type:complete len:255 (+) Transcript_20925:70-834(+)